MLAISELLQFLGRGRETEACVIMMALEQSKEGPPGGGKSIPAEGIPLIRAGR